MRVAKFQTMRGCIKLKKGRSKKLKNSDFNVLSVRMNSVQFQICDNNYNGEIETEITSQYAFADNDRNQAKAEMQIKVFPDVKKTAPFRIVLNIEGIFAWNEQIPRQNIKDFLEINAMALLYSYARPIVTQLTCAASCNPLFLPMINFVTGENADEK